MLRPVCAALLCVILTAAAPRAADVPTDVPTFAGIPWGASRTQVLEAAAASGLRVVASYGNDVELAGEPFGAAAVVHAMLSPTDGLVKVQVRFASNDTPDADLRDGRRVTDASLWPDRAGRAVQAAVRPRRRP